jgi:periplasmic copper chaperone A
MWISGRVVRRLTITAGITGALVALVAGPAGAHVEPDPARVKPGKAVTVEFTPEHGCKGSPTTKMTFQVPKGAKGAAPVAKDGWTTSVTGRKILFEGGSVPDDVQGGFAISFTAPSAKTLLAWKVVQGCEVGETAWIESGHDATNPAPVVGVGKKPPVPKEDGEEDAGH